MRQGAILLGLLVVLFPRVFFLGEVAVPGSLLYRIDPWKAYAPQDNRDVRNETTLESLTQFAPWYTLTQKAIERGEWPLWNHLENTGTPLLANYQSAVLYPFHVLHSFLNVFVCMTIYLLLKLWLCGATAYVLGRALGFSINTSRFVSIGWMLCGFNMVWCYWAEVDVACWLPLLMAGCEWSFRGRYQKGFFAGAIAGTLMLLAGHPETAFLGSLGVAAYFVLRLLLERRRGRALWVPLCVSGIAWIPALLLSAAQILPFLEYLPNSYTMVFRAGQEQRHFVGSWGFMSLWVPKFLGFTADGNYWADINSNFVHIVYCGIVVWCVAPLVFLRSGRQTASNQALAIAFPMVLLGPLAFDFPALRIVHRIPMLSSTWEMHFFFFASLALILLAGIAIERWFERPRGLWDLKWSMVTIFVVATIVGLVAKLHWGFLTQKGLSPYVTIQLLIAGGLVTLTLVTLGVFCFWRQPARLKGILAFLLCADLLYASAGMRPTTPLDDVFPPTALTDFLAQLDQPCRVVAETTGTIPSGVLPVYGIENFEGYDGMYPARIMHFVAECNTRCWSLTEPICSNEYALYRPGTLSEDAIGKVMEYVGTLDGIEIYRNLPAFPRAFLVGKVKIVATAEELLDTLCSPTYKPREEAVTEAPPAAQLPAVDTEVLGTARIANRTSLEVTAEVDAVARCTLVLTDLFFPGWYAFVDGEQTEMFPVYYAFRGVIVPPGKHTVTFVYRPWSFRVGLVVSVVSMVLGSAMSVWLLVRKKNTRETP